MTETRTPNHLAANPPIVATTVVRDNHRTLFTLPGSALTTYTYDTLGRMLSRTDSNGTTTFVWSGMNCVQETDHSGNVTRYYVVNNMLSSFDRTVSGTTTTYQIHFDALTSVRKVTDSSGTVQATYDTDAWGNALASTSDSIPNGGLQYRFVGARGVRWDAGTGLYYMRQRWYDSILGRFLSWDPKRRGNRYGYAANNPAAFIDPSGLESIITTSQRCAIEVAASWIGVLSKYRVVENSIKDRLDPGVFGSGAYLISDAEVDKHPDNPTDPGNTGGWTLGNTTAIRPRYFNNMGSLISILFHEDYHGRHPKASEGETYYQEYAFDLALLQYLNRPHSPECTDPYVSGVIIPGLQQSLKKALAGANNEINMSSDESANFSFAQSGGLPQGITVLQYVYGAGGP